MRIAVTVQTVDRVVSYADVNVWEEPAVSILVSTLNMEAKFYSETSVNTKLHGVTTQKSTLLPLITALFKTVSAVPLTERGGYWPIVGLCCGNIAAIERVQKPREVSKCFGQ